MFQNLINKNIYKFRFAFIINVLLLLYYLAVFYCSFETNDDYTMKMIVSGAYGHPDSHLVFIRSLFGYCLQFLYTILPSWPWYELLQYSLIVLSLSAITYVLLNKGNDPFYHLLVYAIIFVSGHFFYVDLQFTRTASITATAGYLLLYHAIEKQKRCSYIGSIFLIYSGMLLRKNQFLLVSLIAVTVFYPIFSETIRNRKDKETFKKFKQLLLAAMVCVCFFFATEKLDRANYSDPDWLEYRIYNSYRAGLLDRDAINYQSDRAFYEELGLQEIDIRMLQELWNFDDPVVFTRATIKALTLRNTDQKTVENHFLNDLIDQSFALFYKDINGRILMNLLLLTFLLAIVLKPSLTDIITVVLCSLTLLFGVLFTYCYRNYVFMERVQLSVFIVAIVIIASKINVRDRQRNGSLFLLLLLVLTVAFSYLWSGEFKIYSSKKVRDDQKIAAIKEIKADGEHIYIRTTDESLDYISGVFIDESAYADDNIIALGGWMTRMPIREEVKAKYGIMNPFKDIINNDRAYLLISGQDRLELILEYIRLHYDSNVQAIPVKTIQANKTYTVYRIVSE